MTKHSTRITESVMREFEALQRERNRFDEAYEKHRHAQQTMILAVLVAFTVQLATLPELFDHQGTPITKILLLVFSLAIPIMYGFGFVVRATRSDAGLRAYLHVERELLADEIPNIVQIMSLLGFLNVLLRETWVRAIVTAIITLLLLIYLAGKRRKLVASYPEAIRKHITPDVSRLINITLAITLALVVYGLSVLIAAQLNLS